MSAEQRLYDAMDSLVRINEQLGRLIEEGQAAGELQRAADPDVVRALLLDAYARVLLRWTASAEDGSAGFPLREAVHEVCRVVIEGLRA